MSTQSATLRVVDGPLSQKLAQEVGAPLHADLVALVPDGQLHVRFGDGRECLCDWLEASGPLVPALAPGDRVLVLPPARDMTGVVLGRIGRYRTPEVMDAQAHVTIEAAESLTLKCGEASIDLRADGKVMVRGEDVLLRAKGTQRIRAGTVSIN